jgi:uncharacterized protein (DUF305 family)
MRSSDSSTVMAGTERGGGRGAVTASVAVVLLFALTACASVGTSPPTIEAPVPGAGVAEPGAWTPTAADVEFMSGMLHHHAQALVMTALVPQRTDSEGVRLLSRRIDLSQQDEIAFIERWLKEYGISASAHDHPASATEPLMPGMLAEAELDELASSSGEAFDRLFLRSMIRHHQGALTMVQRLLEAPGAAEDADLFQFASHVDSDQRVEIARMARMLSALQQ